MEENMKYIIYEANCVEHGDFFFFKFKSKETDQKKLLKIASREAAGWGAECYSVEKAKDQSPEAMKEVQDA